MPSRDRQFDKIMGTYNTLPTFLDETIYKREISNCLSLINAFLPVMK